MFFCSALTATRTMMKMASVFTFSLLLLCCSVINPAASQNNCDTYAATGTDIVVPLNFKVKNPFRLIWKHNEETIFYKRDGKFLNGKADDVDQTGSLKLKNLTISQSGTYTPEIFDKGGKKETSLKSIRLCVIAAVQKPTVKMECEDSDSNVKFTCTPHEKDLPKKADISVEWKQNDKLLHKLKTWSVKFEVNNVKEDHFTCNISNKASYAASDPVQQTCYSSIFPDELFGINIWVFVGGGAGIVVVLIFIVIICCLRARRMKHMQLKDENELRLQWTNTDHPQHQHTHQRNQPSGHYHHRHHQQQQQQQQQQHHHHCQQQQPAGNTGPRPSRSRQHRDPPRGRLPEPPSNGQPLPSPRRAAQGPRPAENADTEQPPPLPQPRKKAPRAQRV